MPHLARRSLLRAEGVIRTLVATAVIAALKTVAVEMLATETSAAMEPRLKKGDKGDAASIDGASDNHKTPKRLKGKKKCHKQGHVQSKCPKRKCSLSEKLGFWAGILHDSFCKIEQTILLTCDSDFSDKSRFFRLN